jgi:hypothetical protein
MSFRHPSTGDPNLLGSWHVLEFVQLSLSQGNPGPCLLKLGNRPVQFTGCSAPVGVESLNAVMRFSGQVKGVFRLRQTCLSLPQIFTLGPGEEEIKLGPCRFQPLFRLLALQLEIVSLNPGQDIPLPHRTSLFDLNRIQHALAPGRDDYLRSLHGAGTRDATFRRGTTHKQPNGRQSQDGTRCSSRSIS